jgi:AraC-like DNA-binding protein
LPHRNPVTCILAGLDRPLAVCTQAERTEGDIVVIRPGVEHWVEINGSAKVLYFDGLEFPLGATLAARVPGEVATLAIDALASSSGAQEELRARFSRARERCPAAVVRTINAIAHDPMTRMDQGELAERLRLGRTQAMRAFKAATGMTFREFKRWTALCAAARQIADWGDRSTNAAWVEGSRIGKCPYWGHFIHATPAPSCALTPRNLGDYSSSGAYSQRVQ